MKYEPLKNKLKGFDAFTTYTGTTVAFYGFREEDVKSAVEGLFVEIDAIENNNKFRVSNEREGGVLAYSSNTISDVKNAIKKWFPDVVKEGEK